MDNWLIIIVVGLAAGWIAGAIMKGKRQGLLGSLVIGVIGAILGAFIFQFLGIPVTNILGNLVSAVVGAVLLIYLIRMARNI